MKIPEEDYPCSYFKINYLRTMLLLHLQKWRDPGDPNIVSISCTWKNIPQLASPRQKGIACKTCFCKHKSIFPCTYEIQFNQKMSWVRRAGKYTYVLRLIWNLKHFVKALPLILKKCRDFAACIQTDFFFLSLILNAIMIKMVKILRDGAGFLPSFHIGELRSALSFIFQGQAFPEGLVSWHPC